MCVEMLGRWRPQVRAHRYDNIISQRPRNTYSAWSSLLYYISVRPRTRYNNTVPARIDLERIEYATRVRYTVTPP